MAKACDLTGPEVNTAARLHSDEAGWQLRKERQYLRAAQLPFHHNDARRGNRVHLKDLLGQVEANDVDLRYVLFLCVQDLIRIEKPDQHCRKQDRSTPSYQRANNSNGGSSDMLQNKIVDDLTGLLLLH
jgi:hypothetical protein